MNYEIYTPKQRVMATTIANKVENSGCNTNECIEVLSDIIGSLLAYMAPSKEYLTEYIDNKLLPYLRSNTIELHEIKNQII